MKNTTTTRKEEEATDHIAVAIKLQQQRQHTIPIRII
jgi:hypothetical protein